MQITLNELNYRPIERLLESNGFGLVKALCPYSGNVLQARIWTGITEGIPSGQECGTLNCDIGSITRYTLILNPTWIPRKRLELMLETLGNMFGKG